MTEAIVTIKKFQNIPVISGIIVVLIGFAVLGGWITNSTLLSGLFPTLPYMKINTVLAFILSGFTLLFIKEDKKLILPKLRALAFSIKMTL